MASLEPTIKIFFENLAVCGWDGNESKRLPLSQLEDGEHVHGGLRIQVQGRFLPYLGYFGRDDVCFNTWLAELETIYQTFEGQEAASYTFDEGEQGQPAFLFDKSSDAVFLSIVNAEYSGAGADPEWQKVEFRYEDFRQQYSEMKANFISELSQAVPNVSGKWLKHIFSSVAI